MRPPIFTRDNLILAGLFGFFGLVFIGGGWLVMGQPGDIEYGRLLSASNVPGSEGGTAVIEVLTADGKKRPITARRVQIVRCKVGDKIELRRRDRWLQVSERGCLFD